MSKRDKAAEEVRRIAEEIKALIKQNKEVPDELRKKLAEASRNLNSTDFH